MELWKPSREYDKYEVSNEGRVRNIKTGRIMKTNINTKGYEQISLRDGSSYVTERVHKLVADTFIDGDGEGLDVRHKDNNRLNNRVDNLEYCTRSETIKSAYDRGTKKPSRQVKVRVIETGEEFVSIAECARTLGLHQTDICRCVNKAAYTCGGLHFEKVL